MPSCGTEATQRMAAQATDTAHMGVALLRDRVGNVDGGESDCRITSLNLEKLASLVLETSGD